MIGRLRGIIVEQGANGSVVVDVGGVGYEVFVPIGALGRLGGDDDATVTLHVHTHVAAESLTLYGFPSLDDKAAFRSLLSVNKVGPKLALAILGAIDAHQLATAIARSDHGALKGIPGVGRKTIERIFLDLEGKLVVTPGSAGPRPVAAAPRPPTQPAATGPAATVVGALVQMGYKRAEAERAVDTLEVADKATETLLREALAALA